VSARGSRARSNGFPNLRSVLAGEFHVHLEVNGKILAEPTCKLTLTEPPATGIGKPGLCSWQDAAGTSGASPNRSSNRSDLSEEKNCFGSLTNF